MAKRKQRRKQQKQEYEAADTKTNKCYMKTTPDSHSRNSNLKVGNKGFLSPPQEKHIMRSQQCYDAVILHSDEDGKTAYDVKKWLEKHLKLPMRFVESGRSLEIELMGCIDPDFGLSLEKASVQTKTIIILYTRNFGNDLKMAVNGLWRWQAKKQHFKIVHLLVGFGKEDPRPECIAMASSHPLDYKTECEHFHHAMAAHLSCSLEERPLRDEEKGKQHGRKEDKRQEGQGVLISPHPSRSTSDDSTPTGVHQMHTDDEEMTLSPKSENCDSGVASASGFTSVLTPLPSNDDWPCSQDECSLSGPFGLPHDPRMKPKLTVSPLPEVSSRKSRNPPGASGSGVYVEGTNASEVEDKDDCAESYKNAHENSERESEGMKRPNACAEVPVLSSNVMKEDDKRARSGPNQVSHTKGSNTPTKHASSSQLTPSPVSSQHQHDVNSATEGSYVNDHPVSLGIQNCSDSEEDSKSSTSVDKETTCLVPSSVMTVCPDHSKTAELKPEKSDPCDDTDVATDGSPVTRPTDQSDKGFDTSNSAKIRTNEGIKLSTTEDPPQNQVQEVPCLYLTPISCDNDGDMCENNHDAADPGEFKYAGCLSSSLESDDRKISIVRPPNHSYINGVDHTNQTATATNPLPSRVQPQPSAMYLCNPVPDDDEYDTTESVTSELPPSSIIFYHVKSVTIHGSKCQIPEPSTQTASNQRSSDASTPYETWQFKPRNGDYAFSVPETPAEEADSRRATSSRPQLPPRSEYLPSCGYLHPSGDLQVDATHCPDSGKTFCRTKRKKTRLALLSYLRALLPCAKKRKKKTRKKEADKVQNQYREVSTISWADDENPYDLCEPCVRSISGSENDFLHVPSASSSHPERKIDELVQESRLERY